MRRKWLGALALGAVTIGLSGCGAVMAYDRMEQMQAIRRDHNALAACLQTSDNCQNEELLYDADIGAGGQAVTFQAHAY
jgi:hypothetical protein